MPVVELDYYSLVAIGPITSAGPYCAPTAQYGVHSQDIQTVLVLVPVPAPVPVPFQQETHRAQVWILGSTLWVLAQASLPIWHSVSPESHTRPLSEPGHH